MSRAYAMEIEAAERYAQLAEQMDAHNNRDVAQVFRKLSALEAIHARRILEEMNWPSLKAPPPPYAWEGAEGPETAPFESVHYLMQPWHALEIALRCELEAVKYFDGVAEANVPERVREAAQEMALEERGHVVMIRQWMDKVPRPAAGWDEDPDPPRMSE
jgi:rubrerythrin